MFRPRKHPLLLALIPACLGGVGPLRADFIPINVPDAAYTSRTTLLPIPAADIGANPTTDGRLTVFIRTEPSLSSPARGLGTWSGWGIPPLVESATTQVVGLWTHGSGASIVLSFSSPIKTFGFEARPFDHPEAPLPQTVSVSFYKSNRFWLWQPLSSPFDDPGNVQVVGTIDRRIHEDEGALLFAASTTTEYFTHVLIGFRQGAAIARLRYSVGEQPAPTHADLFTIRNGVRTDQVTMNVGEELNLTYLVRFRNTLPEFLDVSHSENTAIFTDPPMGWHAGTSWKATEATRNKVLTLYGRYREPYTGLSITDTVRVYVRP